MKSFRHIPVLAFVLAVAAAVPAFGQSAAPYTLNVKIQVSKLAPEVTTLIVACQIRVGDNNILNSQYIPQPISNGSFNGVVAVPLRFVGGNTVQQLKDARYECLMYLQDAANTLWYPTATPADAKDRPAPASWSNAYPQPGTPFVPLIVGPFPPQPAGLKR